MTWYMRVLVNEAVVIKSGASASHRQPILNQKSNQKSTRPLLCCNSAPLSICPSRSLTQVTGCKCDCRRIVSATLTDILQSWFLFGTWAGDVTVDVGADDISLCCVSCTAGHGPCREQCDINAYEGQQQGHRNSFQPHVSCCAWPARLHYCLMVPANSSKQ